jgi:hypothetical protein
VRASPRPTLAATGISRITLFHDPGLFPVFRLPDRLA